MLLFSRSNWILWNSRVWKLSAGMLPTAVLKVQQPQAWKEDFLVLRPDCGSNYVLSQHLGLLCSLSLFANIHSCYYQFPALTSELPEGRNHIWVCSPLYPWHPAPPDLAHGEHIIHTYWTNHLTKGQGGGEGHDVLEIRTGSQEW